MRYSSEWRRTVERLGRWIDFDNDYKTLNTSYMESVWWVFGQLWNKDLVYRGLKVMPYTTGCTTPLSNFEAGQAYKDVQDPAGEQPLSLVLFKPNGADPAHWNSHYRFQTHQRSFYRSPRLDDHSLDPPYQSRSLCSPRIHLHQNPRQRARHQLHPLRQTPFYPLQRCSKGEEGEEVRSFGNLQG